MQVRFPRIELAHGDLAMNTHACHRWFKVIAWALERHPEGLFIAGLREEYGELCRLKGICDPITDDGEFQGSLSRQLQIALAICNEIGWLRYRFERNEGNPASTTAQPRIAVRAPVEPLWILTKPGARANRWHERKLTRAIALHLFRRGIVPVVAKVRLPLALASATIGIVKLAHGWGEAQATLEGIVAIAGAGVIAALHPAQSRPPT